MPSETLDIIVRLRDQASRGFRALGVGVQGLRSSVDMVSSAVFSLKGALAGVGAGLLARSFTQAASSAESYRTRLNVLLRSQAEGNRLFKEMSDFAGTVSFQYEEIMGAATNLAGVMKGGVDEIKQWMPGIADLAAASGLGIQDTTQQIIRMYSAGAASADLFRDRGVLAMLGFQAGVSYSAEETRARLMEVFEDPTSQVKGAATELAKTWEGMLSMVADRWFQFRNLVMEGGVFDFMKAALAELLDFMDRLQKEGRLGEWAAQMADAVLDAFDIIAKGVAVVGDAYRGWRMIWEGLKAAFSIMMIAIMRGTYKMAEVVSDITGMLEDRFVKLGEILIGIGEVTKNATAKSMGLVLANATGISEKSKEIADGARIAEQYWGGIFDQSEATLGTIAAQGSYLNKVNDILGRIRARAAEYAKEAAKAKAAIGGGPAAKPEAAPSAAIETIFKSQIARGREVLRTGMAQLQALYDQGEITLADYFARRKTMLVNQFATELAIMEERAAKETEVNKRMAIEDQIFALRQQHTRQILALDEEQRKSAQKLADDRMAAEEAMRRSSTEGLAYLQGAMETAYAASGDTIKEFFTIGQGASVALATISTYEAAQHAYAGMVKAIPGPIGIAAGIAAAIGAVAQGLGRVAMMKRQRLAGGGEVGGYSPSPTADNIPAWLTAKEFVQPVDAVQYYGKPVMEGLRRKLIPRGIFAGLGLPQPRRGPQFAFAGGGPVPDRPPPTGPGEVKILNFVDPNEMLAALDSPEGDDAIVNAISRNNDKIVRVLR